MYRGAIRDPGGNSGKRSTEEHSRYFLREVRGGREARKTPKGRTVMQEIQLSLETGAKEGDKNRRTGCSIVLNGAERPEETVGIDNCRAFGDF